MGLNYAYSNTLGKQESISLLQAAVERGVTFFDTAEMYAPRIRKVYGIIDKITNQRTVNQKGGAYDKYTAVGMCSLVAFRFIFLVLYYNSLIYHPFCLINE